MVTTPAPTPTAWKIPLYFVFAPKINESSIHNEDYFEMTRRQDEADMPSELSKGVYHGGDRT